MLYKDFVREQFKTRPAGTSVTEYMKKVGELWREKKNTVTKEETVPENIKGEKITKEFEQDMKLTNEEEAIVSMIKKYGWLINENKLPPAVATAIKIIKIAPEGSMKFQKALKVLTSPKYQWYNLGPELFGGKKINVMKRDVVNKTKTYYKKNSKEAKNFFEQGKKELFILAAKEGVKAMINKMVKDEKTKKDTLFWADKIVPIIAGGFYDYILDKIKGGAISQEGFPYTPLNKLIDVYYQENNEFKQLYE